MKRNAFFCGLIFVLIFSSCRQKTISLESLLNEMTDRMAITMYPKPEYQVRQFSSYDRKSVSPDSSGWWANADYTQFIRAEENRGRREFVLFDADGPGAVVRWWMTFAGEGASDGIVRIYFDDSDEPEVEANILEVLSGEKLAPYPLAAAVSPETEYERRGHNLYLPVPFSEHCKITYECSAVKFENNRWRPSIYYNINYRKYKPGTTVESFSMEVLEKNRALIAETATLLLTDEETRVEKYSGSEEIQPGDSLKIVMDEKGSAIESISLKLDAANLNQALRSTVVSIRFDGTETVWIPAGELFGTGYQLNTSKTWYSEVNDEGQMKIRWIMPFKKRAEIFLVNYHAEPVRAELKVATTAYRWKKESMYFGASWHELNRIHTAKDSTLENHEWHFDVNYIDLKGTGVYAGDALTVFNTVDAWWGEGDEKIFVDGEEFPSCIGTGTEDYYGYAWCRPEKFTHPFIAQPTGAGNFHPGMTVNLRFRALDAMPFEREISSNIEMWHWVKTRVNYGMSAFWYAKPGFESNIHPDIETVKIPVALKRSDIYKPVVDKNGKMEGEFLEVLTFDSGDVSTQSGNFGWSNDNQLWWINAEPGAEMMAKLILKETAKYRVEAQLTKAVDYGIIQLSLNGIKAGVPFNGYYAEGVIPVRHQLGTFVLSKGENILTVKILGADKRAKPGNMAGIDFLQFEKVQ